MDGSAVTQPISGTVTANAGTGPFPVSDNGGSLTVDGTVAVSGSVAVTGPLTDTQLRATPVPVSFSTGAGTPTVSRVAVSATVATLAAANSSRKRLIVHNETGTLYVKLGTGCTDTDYTYRLTANTLLEIPFSHDAAVTAIKASGSSFAQVTSVV